MGKKVYDDRMLMRRALKNSTQGKKPPFAKKATTHAEDGEFVDAEGLDLQGASL